MNLSIIVPVYNSEKILPLLIKSISDNLKESKISYEIILVNDFSKDQSWNTIVNLARSYKFVKGINLKKNYGQHSAIFIGLKFCEGRNLICMDDDMQHDPIYLLNIYNELIKGFDVCYVKYANRQHSQIKIFISWLNNIVSSYLMEKSSKIYTSSFKGFNSDIKNAIINKSSKNIFLDYWIIKNYKKIKIIEVSHKKRLEGETNYNFRELLTLWSKMIFLIDIKKLGIKTLIISTLRVIFKTFLKKYLKIQNSEEILIESKTF